MQQLHLQEEEALKSQRVTEAEAQQIVHLWAEGQKQAATHAGPTVHDIAEGLEIPPEEAMRLLQQVRQKQEVQVQTHVRRKSHMPLFVAAAVMALVAFMLMVLLVSFRSEAIAPASVEVATPAAAPNVTPPTAEGATTTQPASPVTLPPQPGHPASGLPK